MFKITIEHETEETQTKGREWKVIGSKENDIPEYGYTPEIQKVVQISRTIYMQTVNELDLPAVIAAVNAKKE